MELLIWYSEKHKTFKTRFGFLSFGKSIGYVNGFGEELMLVAPLFYSSQTIKESFIKFLQKVINRLESPKKTKRKVVYIKERQFPWWKY